MADDLILLVGTAKGLFRFRSPDRHSWRQEGPDFIGAPIYAAVQDPRSGTLLAGVNDIFYGPSVRRSHDLGATWDQGGSGLAYPADDPEQVTRVWSILPGPAGEPDVIYAGVEASGLFRSCDGGDSWQEVASVRTHPTHDLWFSGFGGKCMHTLAQDPHRPARMYFACSTGGIYRTDDGGETWAAKNEGIRCDFAPEDQRYPVAGQCVHKFSLAATANRVYLQNHGGVYRSDDGGDTWLDIGQDLPSDFGFPVVAHPKRADTAYIIPLDGPGRLPPGLQLAVHRTDDAGRTWRSLESGLPGSVFAGVLRDGFGADHKDPLGLYLGTTSGSLFASTDEGEHWEMVADHLPRIHSVTVARATA